MANCDNGGSYVYHGSHDGIVVILKKNYGVMIPPPRSKLVRVQINLLGNPAIATEPASEAGSSVLPAFESVAVAAPTADLAVQHMY